MAAKGTVKNRLRGVLDPGHARKVQRAVGLAVGAGELSLDGDPQGNVLAGL